MDILHKIIEHKRLEVENAKRLMPQEQLQESIPLREYTSLYNSLSNSPYGIISEFKRKSPSKGWIHPNANITEVIPLYETGGAAALSILTDNAFFGGGLDDLQQAKSLSSLPVLRKDFIIDEYQLLQAAAAGADAVLLIAAALEPSQCESLAQKAHSLGLEVLLEIHELSELSYVTDSIHIVGVNNRNLGTFHTDINNSLKIADMLPTNKLLISESGISNPQTVRLLRNAGFRGFLIGECFMKEDDPGIALSKFINELNCQS